MSKIELEKTLGQIAQSIGTFNSTLITLKRGQDEVKDALACYDAKLAKFTDMVEEMGVHLHLCQTDLGRIQMALPHLVKDAKAAEHKRTHDRNHKRKMRKNVARQDTDNVARQSECRATKESEKDKEESSPHTPLIGEREKEKEALPPRVCAREGMPAECAACECFSPFSAVCRAVKEGTRPSTGVVDVHKPPCLPLLKLYAHKVAHINDDTFIKEFYQVVGVEGQWQNTKTENQIHNWPRYFREFFKNKDKMGVLMAGKPIVANGGIRGNQFGSRDHATNYLPPTEADKRNFALPKGV